MIKINSKPYDAVVTLGYDGIIVVTFDGDTSIDEIVRVLSGVDTKIEVFENDAVVAVYFTRILRRVEYANGKVVASLNVSTITEDDKTTLELAIAELAELMGEFING